MLDQLLAFLVDPSTGQTAQNAALGGLGGMATTLALLTFRTSKAEKSIESVSGLVSALGEKVSAHGDQVMAQLRASEQKTDEKLDQLRDHVCTKIDGLREAQSEHRARLAVLENGRSVSR